MLLYVMTDPTAADYFRDEVKTNESLFVGSRSTCNATEVAAVLRSMGIDIRRDELLTLMKRVGPTGQGHLTLPQFCLLVELQRNPNQGVQDEFDDLLRWYHGPGSKEGLTLKELQEFTGLPNEIHTLWSKVRSDTETATKADLLQMFLPLHVSDVSQP